EYEPEVVVESYLRPGLPFAVILTKSVGFFDTLQLQYVRNATVVMEYGNASDTLAPLEISLESDLIGQVVDTALLINFGPLFGESLVVYASLGSVVPNRFDLTYRLTVITEEGDTLRSSTMVPPPVEFNSNSFRFNDDSLAIFLTNFQDDHTQANFYRRLLQQREERDSAWVTRTNQDFVLDDAIGGGDLITFGTGFEFEQGDTLISTLYHITRDYWRFSETRDDAIAASLSPFAQPALIHTNIEGGQGLFAGFSVTSDTIVIE
ncbi:MAG: DUF4249 domain-containing protein, partial [Bacteroidota bacterium]